MALTTVGLKDIKDLSGKIYHALMGDSVTTMLLIGMPVIEVILPQLTMIFLGLALFFGVRSTVWKIMNERDERRVKKETAIAVSSDQIRSKELDVELNAIELEKDKFKLKRDVITKQENFRGQVFQKRLNNLEKRNEFNIKVGLKVIEEAGINAKALSEIEAEFSLIREGEEFLATEGLTVPFEELFVDKKTNIPVADAFKVTDEKFKKINIGDNNDE